MATEVQNQSEESVASLMSGIAHDFGDLVKQQLRLTRQEIEADLRKSKEPAALLALGWALCLVGAFAVCLMLAHLFHWLGAPAGTDPSSLPLWASFAIAGSLFLIAGGVSIMVGRNKIETMAPPLQQTVQAMQENIEWKTKASPS